MSKKLEEKVVGRYTHQLLRRVVRGAVVLAIGAGIGHMIPPTHSSLVYLGRLYPLYHLREKINKEKVQENLEMTRRFIKERDTFNAFIGLNYAKRYFAELQPPHILYDKERYAKFRNEYLEFLELEKQIDLVCVENILDLAKESITKGDYLSAEEYVSMAERVVLDSGLEVPSEIENLRKTLEEKVQKNSI